MKKTAAKHLANKLFLAVQYATDSLDDLPSRGQLRRWVKSALQQDASVTLRIVDAAEGRELNKNYRGKDYATNVLTFVYADAKPPACDIVICAPVVKKEAAAQRKVLLAHYAHLTIHAMLHLHGYSHDNDVDAAQMEALETDLMVKLRLADPYRTTRH
ncbi:MAG TPA: rRNA maturation RNase YbeY [Gallionella sp.]|nr:rRNA maturation RNase YbeY [Gallionella sp.]